MKSFLFMVVGLLLISCSPESKKEISLTGTLESIEVTISSKVAGEVKYLAIDEGSKISTDDTLLIIDAADYEIQYKQALANAEVSEAQYLQFVRGTRKEDLNQAEESLIQAEANFKNAEDDYHRINNLFETGSVSNKQKDDAQTRYTVVQAQYNSAKQLVEKLRVGSRAEEILSAKARFNQSKAQAEAVKKKLDDCKVLSPMPGYVTKRLVEKGEFVGVGMPLVRIANLDVMNIMVYLPETQLGKVNLGDKAEVTIDTYPDKKFSGEVIFISPEAEFTPKNIQTKEERVKLVFGVKVKVKNPDHSLKAGLPADVVLKLSDKQ
jgi:HlyD family secretion protein